MPRICYYGPAVAWAFAIFLSSSQPASAIPKITIPFADKLAHGFVFGVLGLLTARAVGRGKPITGKQAFLACALGALYGLTDEWHQMNSDGRTAEFSDWVMDLLGASIGVMVWKNYLGQKLGYR